MQTVETTKAYRSVAGPGEGWGWVKELCAGANPNRGAQYSGLSLLLHSSLLPRPLIGKIRKRPLFPLPWGEVS